MGIDIDQINLTTSELLKKACQSAGNKTYMYFIPQDKGETFEEYSLQVNQISHFFEKDLKIRPGAKVCIMSDNSPELLHVISAVTNIGAIWVPINTQLIGESLRLIIDESDAQIILTSGAYEKRIFKVMSQIRRTLEVVRIEDLAEKSEKMPIEYESSVKPHDIFVIMYTSGTTGSPKGVMHTHRSFIRIGLRSLEILETTSDDRIHVYLPLFHSWAYLVTLGAMYFNATIYVDNKFDIRRYWDDVDKYQITQDHWTGTVPLALMKLSETKVDKQRRMRIFGTFGAIYDSMKQRWPEMSFQSLYGQTEHPAATAVPPNKMRHGIDGVPMDPDEILILGKNGEVMPSGVIGEIIIRCQCGVGFIGYYKNPEATAKALKGSDIYTGDLGYLDGSGNLHFIGRLKDALRVRGEMLSVEHVENLINRNSKIAECAIVGYQPSDKIDLKEDEVIAHVVLKDQEKMTEREFAEWTEQNLARFMRPRYLVFRDLLPKTVTDRVQRYKLRNKGLKDAQKLF